MNAVKKLRYGVLGAGAWGTAFANLIAKSGSSLIMWDRNLSVVNDINSNSINARYFPSLLSKNIKATNDIEEMNMCDAIVIALPFQALREFLENNPILKSMNAFFLLLSKGIEISTNYLGHQIVEELLPNSEYAIISGPNFANEIIEGLPASMVVATESSKIFNQIKLSIGSSKILLQSSDDIIGVEVCGAIKNIIAIASGICIGARYGQNAKASLITYAIEEIKRLIKIMGGNVNSVDTVAGIGDLILTCNSLTSRNYKLGFEIGKLNCYADHLKPIHTTTEGVYTCRAIHEICTLKQVNLNICHEIYKILYENKSVSDAVTTLLNK